MDNKTLELRKILQTAQKNSADNNQNLSAIHAEAPQLASEIENLKQQKAILSDLGISNPYFKILQTKHDTSCESAEPELLNFSSYNYLGLSGDKRVNEKAITAIKEFGTSVGASRIASGERTFHQVLEKLICEFLGFDAAVAMVSGYGAIETTIGHVACERDLIVHDSLIHRCVIEGTKLSKCKSIPFVHNDLSHLEKILERHRSNFQQCIIVVEGLYSMDGDICDLPELVRIKNEYDSFLMVDEAHSLGVLGKTGRGISEHWNVKPNDIDFCFLTLSKTLASCGGVVLSRDEIVDYLRYTSPGFVFSVGMTPANASAAIAALEILRDEPARVSELKQKSTFFWKKCRQAKLNVGESKGFAVVPVITGSSQGALILSEKLLQHGINAQPILFPAIPEGAARVRIFVNLSHTYEQLDFLSETLIREMAELSR